MLVAHLIPDFHNFRNAFFGNKSVNLHRKGCRLQGVDLAGHLRHSPVQGRDWSVHANQVNVGRAALHPIDAAVPS